MWPNFFIVGAPKAGTTTLHHYLEQIPGIYMSKIKEPNYFSIKTIPNKKPFYPIRDTASYLDLFNKGKNEKIVGESSTNYLYDPNAANLILQRVPDAYILMSLRDPVERAWSHYLMLKSAGKNPYPFSEQIKKELKQEIDFDKNHIRLDAGMYYNDVKKFLELFGKKQVKIIIFEEWTKNIKNTLNEIIKFLGLNYKLENNIQERISNPYETPRGSISQGIIKIPQIRKISSRMLSQSAIDSLKKILLKKGIKPKMSEDARNELIKFYQEDVSKMEKFLGRKLPWTNFLM